MDIAMKPGNKFCLLMCSLLLVSLFVPNAVAGEIVARGSDSTIQAVQALA